MGIYQPICQPLLAVMYSPTEHAELPPGGAAVSAAPTDLHVFSHRTRRIHRTSPLQEISVCSVHSVGGCRLLCWCSRDCCPPLKITLRALRLAMLRDSLFDEHFELLAEFGVVLQQSLCSVATLRQLRAVVAVPRARLLDDAVLYAEVYNLANL